ncbi:unnamed protein product [Chrysodeixis includens]|uniref:Uncharacterized protein n=1 Tax=Chrysodeixis includens TaxID=689277 RepID=A0A9P0BX82_CHRIL|nr:unnamed protein product [Chrysodeixis includens]
MTFRWSFVIFVIVMFTFNITEFECSKNVNTKKNTTFLDKPAFMTLITEYPLGITEVFDDASGVFRNILWKIFSKKKLVGLDPSWSLF